MLRMPLVEARDEGVELLSEEDPEVLYVGGVVEVEVGTCRMGEWGVPQMTIASSLDPCAGIG